MPDIGSSRARTVAAFCGRFSGQGAGAGARAQPDDAELVHSGASGWVAIHGDRQYCEAVAPAAGGFAAVTGRPFSLSGCRRDLDIDAPGPTLAALDGRFALVSMNDHALVLATDILGARALFYYVGADDALYFASHLGLLLDILPEVPGADRLGTAAILAGSCQIGGRTHRHGVRRLGAASMLGARSGRSGRIVAEEAYLSVEDELCPSGFQSKPTTAAFEQVFLDAVQREGMSGRDALMLSGGLDSRAIACAIALTSSERPTSYSYGEWRSADLRGARDTAAALGFRHRRLAYGGWSFEGFARRVISLSGGMAGLQTAHNTIGIARLPRRVDSAISGFLGDALSGAHLGRSDRINLLHFRNWYGPDFERIYGQELKTLDRSIGLLYRFPRATPVQAAVLRDLVIRQATWISTTHDLWEWILPVKTPFFSRALIRFFLCLPEGALRQQSLYRAWIDAAAQEVSRRTQHRVLRHASRRLTDFICDRVYWRTGLLGRADCVAWRRRIMREREYLRRLAAETPNGDVADVLRGELAAEHFQPHVLLAAAQALAAIGAHDQHDDATAMEPGVSSGAV